MRPETQLAPRAAQSSSWRWIALVLLVLPALVLRVWLVKHFPEPDADAPGHLGIARAVMADPWNIAVHWVYLPAYHFLLAAFLLAGLNADTIRLVNCGLAALVPVLVLLYAESALDRSEGGGSKYVPWMAATFCTVSPLVNLLGTSAQQETLFTLLVLGAVWSIDAERFALGGAILALASLIRYEAWGAVAMLVAFRIAGSVPAITRKLPAGAARVCRLPVVVAAPSVVAIGGWLLAHRLREGQWLGFLHELYRYAQAQRESLHRGPLWFPFQQPLFVFGSLVALLFFAGVRRAARISHVIPFGIYVFLLGAYAFKGALGSARYYESLMPFVALAAAYGACSVGARWRWLAPAMFFAASLQLVGLSTQLFLWTWPGPEAPGSRVESSTGDGARKTASNPQSSGARLPAREARSSRR